MARLSLLIAEFGEDIPYVGALANGFPFRGRRVPFLNYQKGIYRAAVQTGPAALSIQTSSKSPYDDEVVTDGFLYAYRAGDVDQPDNRALRAAHDLNVPIVYFIGTRPGWYKPIFPCFVRQLRATSCSADPGSGRAEPMRGDLHHLFTCERKCNSFRGQRAVHRLSRLPRGRSRELRQEGDGPVRAGGRERGRRARDLLLPAPLPRAAALLGRGDRDAPRVARGRAGHSTSAHRNAAIFERQGNRNPLIDHPEWALGSTSAARTG